MNLSKGLNIEFLGLIKNRDKLFQIMKNAELFIFPSLFEAMSMMLLEVVSLKTPVLASDIDANRSVFSDEKMLFFQSENVDDLADKLIYALNNKKDMKVRAQVCFNKLIKNYTWVEISKQYDEYYQELLH